MHPERNGKYLSRVRYRDLLPSPFRFKIRISVLALGLGLCEAAFIFAARWGLKSGSPLVFVSLSILALLRFAFQDRLAVLETRAMRKVVSESRRRLLDMLRNHSVPGYRPDFKRDLSRTLETTLPRMGEGFLAHQRFTAAILQGIILVPCLFLLSWRMALTSLLLVFPAWLAVRWRSRSLRALERSETQGRVEGKNVVEDFGDGLESVSNDGLIRAAGALESDLEKTQEPEWRWRLAQARYPVLLETGFFFALAALVLVGRGSLGTWDSWILFSGLLLLAYRPVREAARHYPVSLQGAQAILDVENLLHAWKKFPLRKPPEIHLRNSLALENVTFGYEPERAVLTNLSAEFFADAVTGITGPNGAGKTTLLRLLSGAEIPLSGRVLWPESIHKHGGVSYLPQRVSPGRDWLEWCNSLKEKTPARWKGLDDLLGLVRLMKKSIHPEALSGGERQRMALARALCSDAPFLLTDEPTTALPADEREEILKGALRFWKRGAILVTHEPFIGNVCDAMGSLNSNTTVSRLEHKEPVRK